MSPIGNDKRATGRVKVLVNGLWVMRYICIFCSELFENKGLKEQHLLASWGVGCKREVKT